MKTIVFFLCLLFLSCGYPIVISEDGCILQSYTQDGQTYYAGPCLGDKGQIDRGRFQWDNQDGVTLRLTVSNKRTYVEYLTETGGIWVEWDEKSGVVLGPVPVEAENHLENSQ